VLRKILFLRGKLEKIVKFRFFFWDVLPCKIIVDRRFRALMMEAARTSETPVDNHFTRQYIPEDKSKLHTRRRENLKSHKIVKLLYNCGSQIEGGGELSESHGT
jgi:hypothetical protein